MSRQLGNQPQASHEREAREPKEWSEERRTVLCEAQLRAEELAGDAKPVVVWEHCQYTPASPVAPTPRESSASNLIAPSSPSPPPCTGGALGLARSGYHALFALWARECARLLAASVGALEALGGTICRRRGGVCWRGGAVGGRNGRGRHSGCWGLESSDREVVSGRGKSSWFEPVAARCSGARAD